MSAIKPDGETSKRYLCDQKGKDEPQKKKEKEKETPLADQVKKWMPFLSKETMEKMKQAEKG